MFETKTSTTQKHLFAYLTGRELTIRRDYRPHLRGRRYDLNRMTDANQKRLARALAAFDTSVELDDDMGATVYFAAKAAR